MAAFLGFLASPSSAIYCIFALGLLAYLWRATRPYSWALLAISGIANLVFSSGVVGAALMSPLEYSQPALHSTSSHPEAKHIVTLTGWAADDSDMPLSGRLNASSAYRVLLTLELARECDVCTVVVSGERVTARIMRDVLLKLGLDEQRVVLEDKSNSTMESAQHLGQIVGRDPFVLVTSGGHIPRALYAMQVMKLHAIAAPTDHQLPKRWRDAQLLPSPSSLTVSDLAVHEHLGLLWYRLRGGL
jgi:uncharacterized SAM-binding protein YcdF (DUF218 family)